MMYLLCLLTLVSCAALVDASASDTKGCHAKKGGGQHCPSASASASAFHWTDPEPEAKPEASDPNCLTGPYGARYHLVNGKKVVGCK